MRMVTMKITHIHTHNGKGTYWSLNLASLGRASSRRRSKKPGAVCSGCTPRLASPFRTMP